MTTRTYTYYPVGNLTYKSDVGSYNYNPASPACAAGAGGGPHALRCIAGTVNGIANPSFSYDANGNLTAGLGRSLTYTSFNLPATITAPNNLVPGTTTAYTYVYNAEHERVKHIIQRTDGTFTTIYLHPAGKGALLYEKEIKPTLTEHKHYISAGGQLIGVYLTRSDASTETRYFHSDRLGSLTLITNAAGAQIERLAYEAYGKRRNPNGTDDPNSTLYGITTDRGFTGHEHLDEIALIHMNGRIYDPLLARFMTPDPYIQAPALIVSYNRYAYVWDNPLAGTDPTGYLGHFFDPVVDPVVDAWHGVWRSDVGRVAVTVAVAYFTGQMVGNWLTSSAIQSGTSSAFANITFLETQGTLVGTSLTAAGQAVVGASAGFAVGMVASNGNLESGLKGAASGALIGGVDSYFSTASSMERVAARSFTGGLAASIQGGRFEDGVLSAGINSGARYLYASLVGRDVTAAPGVNQPNAPTYRFDENGRQLPESYAQNVIGFNRDLDPKTPISNLFTQSQAVSQALNLVPGINAIAALDDWPYNAKLLPDILAPKLLLTIPGSIAITVPALLDRIPVYRPLDPFGRRQ